MKRILVGAAILLCIGCASQSTLTPLEQVERQERQAKIWENTKMVGECARDWILIEGILGFPSF
jgi:hypothetical protein